MATNNLGHLLDSGGNVAVDFVWGNFPMQPNDDRDEATQGNLIANADSHNIVYAGWNGYPLYTPNDAGKGVGNVVVPEVRGETSSAASDACNDAGLVPTVNSAANNNAKTITAVVRASGSTIITFTASSHGFKLYNKITTSSLDAEFNGTWQIIDVPNSNTFRVAGTATTAYNQSSLSGSAVAVSGTIKSQSIDAGQASVAVGQAITLVPWA